MYIGIRKRRRGRKISLCWQHEAKLRNLRSRDVSHDGVTMAPATPWPTSWANRCLLFISASHKVITP